MVVNVTPLLLEYSMSISLIPVEAQVIDCDEPIAKVSPPFGESKIIY
jgi:hypothetical protein